MMMLSSVEERVQIRPRLRPPPFLIAILERAAR